MRSLLALWLFHRVDHHAQAPVHALLGVERDVVLNLAVPEKHHAVRIRGGARQQLPYHCRKPLHPVLI